jgi:hypothetical protein
MKIRVLLVLGFLAVSSLSVLAQTKAAAQTPKQVADEVIAATRAQWAAEMKKDSAAWQERRRRLHGVRVPIRRG